MYILKLMLKLKQVAWLKKFLHICVKSWKLKIHVQE